MLKYLALIFTDICDKMNRCGCLPVNAGALDAQGDSQVDGGPARLLFPTVTTHVVPGTPGGDAQRWGAATLGGVSTTRGRGEFFRLKTERRDTVFTLSHPHVHLVSSGILMVLCRCSVWTSGLSSHELSLRCAVLDVLTTCTWNASRNAS